MSVVTSTESMKTLWTNWTSYTRLLTISVISIITSIWSYISWVVIPSSLYDIRHTTELEVDHRPKSDVVSTTKKQSSPSQKHSTCEDSTPVVDLTADPAASTTSSPKDSDLFPNISSEPFFHDTKLCSTGITSSYMPVKNEEGKFEWKFSEEFVGGDELDAFKLGPNNSSVDDLSPTVSHTSSNIDSIISDANKREKQLSPPTTHSSPPFSPGEGETEESTSPNSKDSNKFHQCPHCDATFKIRGYLTRHLKKHATKKAYSCPFHQFSIYIDDNNITHKCHPNGGFSRRDTYKTHLKSRHFKYPKGTKTKDRVNSLGNCSMCGEFFPNAEIWCELHVEGGECKFLPVGFKGKSRIKNRLKRQLKHGQPVQELLMPNEAINHDMVGHDITIEDPTNRDMNTVNNHLSLSYNQRHLPPPTHQLDQNFNIGTPNSEISSHQIYDYRNSPISISSSIPMSTSPNNCQQMNNMPMNPSLMNNENHKTMPTIDSSQYTNENQTPNINLNTHQFSPENTVIPNSHIIHANHVNMVNDSMYDYDDDFCLDTDQLNNGWNNRLSHIEPV